MLHPPSPPPPSSASNAAANANDSSWVSKLFNMDGNADSTEIAFLWLVVFGVLVLTVFLVYLLCRIFCFDFWARNCFLCCRKQWRSHFS